MKDKRHKERRDSVLYLAVRYPGDDEVIACTADISGEGLLLVSEHPFEIGKGFDAVVDLPPAGIRGHHSFRCRLIPRWQRPDLNPDYTLTGCLMKPEDEDAHIVEDLLSRYSFSAGYEDFREMFDLKKHLRHFDDRKE